MKSGTPPIIQRTRSDRDNSSGSSMEGAWRKFAERYPRATIPRPKQMRRVESGRKKRGMKKLKKKFTKTLQSPRCKNNVSPVNIKNTMKPSQKMKGNMALSNLHDLPSTEAQSNSPAHQNPDYRMTMFQEVPHNMPKMLKVIPRVVLINYILTGCFVFGCVALGVMLNKEMLKTDANFDFVKRNVNNLNYLIGKVNEIEKTLNDLSEEFNATKISTNETIKELKEDIQNTHHGLQYKIDEATKSLESLQVELSKDFVRKDVFHEAVNAGEESDLRHSNDIRQIEDRINNADEKSEKITNKLETTHQLANNLNDQLLSSPWKEDINNKHIETNNAIEKLSDHVDDIQDKVKEHNTSLDEAHEVIGKLGESLEATKTILREDVVTRAQFDEEILNTSAMIEDQTKEISDLKANSDEIKNNVTLTSIEVNDIYEEVLKFKDYTNATVGDLERLVLSIEDAISDTKYNVTSFGERVDATLENITSALMNERNDSTSWDSEIEAVLNTITELKMDVEALKMDIQNVNGSLTEEKENAENYPDLDELNNEIKSLKEDFVELKRSFSEQNFTIKETIDTNTDRILMLERLQIDDKNLLDQVVKEQQKTLSTIDGVNQTTSNKISNVTTHLHNFATEIGTNIQSMKTRIKGLESSNSKTGSTLAEMREQIDNITKAVDMTVKEESTRVRRSLDSELESFHDTIEERVILIEEKVQKVDEEKASLENNLSDLVERVNKIGIDDRFLNDTIHHLKTELNEYSTNLTMVENEIEKLKLCYEKKQSDLNKTKQELSNEFNNARARIDVMETELKQMKADLENKEFGSDKHEMDEIKKEISILKKRDPNKLFEEKFKDVEEKIVENFKKLDQFISNLNNSLADNMKVQKIEFDELEASTSQKMTECMEQIEDLENLILEVNQTLLFQNESKPWFNDIQNIERKIDKVDVEVATVMKESEIDHKNTAEIIETVGDVLHYQRETLESLQESLKRLSKDKGVG